MKPFPALVSACLILSACQSAPQIPLSGAAPAALSTAGSPAQPSLATPVVLPQSPVLPTVKFAPQGQIQIQASRVKVSMKLPALSPDTGFKTQALDLSDAAQIVATVSDSHGKTYTPVGAVSGKVPYPTNGELELSFTGVVPDQLLFVTLQVEDSTANIPQADLAAVVSHTGVSDVNATVDFQTTPTAKALKLLVDTDADQARAVNLADLVTLVAEITQVSGTAPNATYGTHPSLVNTAELASDLAVSQPADLNAADYRQDGATVALTVAGLVGSDQIEVQITDAASARAVNLENGSRNIVNATPGASLKVLTGASAGNSTQYTFVATPSTLTLSEDGTTNVTITATPTAVSITSMAPTAGAIGSSVEITGTGFSTVEANNTVKFGTTDATVTDATATSLTVNVPPGVSGTQSVTVTVGSQTSSGVDYAITPVVSSLSANAGSIGSSLTLTGTGFSATDEDNTVFFGSTEATVTAATATSLTVEVPAGISGAQNVSVEVGSQTSGETRTFNVTPVLSSLSLAAAAPNSSITLTGTGFSTSEEDNTVFFGSTAATVTAATATTLTVTVPNVAGAQNVNVTVAGETSGNLSFNSIPAISSLSVSTGSTGDSITLNGLGFAALPATSIVKLGDAQATVTSATSTQIVATLTEAPAGVANATVQVGSQTSAAASFTRLPKITSLTTAESLGGKAVLIRSQLLTIAGSNFDPIMANNTVKFGALTPVAVESASATEITVRVPAGVDTPGDVNVSVITNAQTSTAVAGVVPSINLNITDGGFH
ncbi:MAG: IPT/TIG domain-containing protein [Candidatus Sericytochromatia bacterium]